MWHWLFAHTNIVGAVLSFLMLVVWVTYLQLLLIQFRAAWRSSIFITRAAGRGMRSRCLVTNMSSQPIYVTSLIGTLHVGERRIELALTDLRDLPEDLGSDPRSRMAQGSLDTGDYLNIGHFDEIIGIMLEANNEEAIAIADVRQLDLTVVALYAREDLPVGASRSFSFQQSYANGRKVQPLGVATEQITDRRRRRELLRQVERHM